MKVGDLGMFGHIYNGCTLNHKTFVYLGEDFIHRPDGVTVRNHRILELGALQPTCIDEGLLKYMFFRGLTRA